MLRAPEGARAQLLAGPVPNMQYPRVPVEPRSLWLLPGQVQSREMCDVVNLLLLFSHADEVRSVGPRVRAMP